jgi:hypothetical protein
MNGARRMTLTVCAAAEPYCIDTQRALRRDAVDDGKIRDQFV